MGRNLARIMLALLLFAAICSAALVPSVAAAEVCFPETGKCVGDRFYRYWEEHGGLAQQGYPITDPISETVTAEGPLKGKKLTVQYFERARFEYHPENADPQYQVLLGLLGDEQFRAKYPDRGPAKGAGCEAGQGLFLNTSFCVPDYFADYWRGHGGLAQQGYPISRAFVEKSPTNGQEYTVQYFERARFEYHPENDEANRILLGLLGREQFLAKYPNGQPPAVAAPPVPPPPGSAVPQRFSGTNKGYSQVFTLKPGLAQFQNSYTGSSNFIVHLIDSRLETVCYVANEIGNTKSSTACNIPAQGSYRLEVESKGSWIIEVLQPGPVEFAAAVGLPTTFSGTGRQITRFFVAAAPGLELDMKYVGKSNFIVHVVDSEGEVVSYAANEIGSVTLTKLLRLDRSGVYFLEVESSGQWTITVTQYR